MDGTTADLTVSPSLHGLPEELVSNIAVRLGCDDFAAFRLTCRTIEAKSFHEFATEHFAAKAVMITTDSLKVLVGIAESDRLRKYLRGIFITTALFSDKGFHYCPNGCHCVGQPTVRELEAFRFYQSDQKNLKKSHDDRNLLVSALQQLPCLESLTFVDSPTAINAIKPGVDYRGSRKAKRTTGRSPTYAPDTGVDAEYEKWQLYLWKTIMLAVAQSGITSLKSLNTSFVRGQSNGLTVADSFKFGPKALKALKVSFRNTVATKFQFRSQMVRKTNGTIDMDASRQRLHSFATIFGSLEHLDLCGDGAMESLIVFDGFVNNLKLANLTEMRLNTMDIGGHHLSTTLTRLTSLKTLHFLHVNIVDGSWLPILKRLQKITSLEHLHLFYMRENSQKAYVLKQLEPPTHHHHDHGNLADAWGVPPGDDEEDDYEFDPDDDSDGDMPDLEPGPPGPSLPSIDNTFMYPPTPGSTIFGPPPPPTTQAAHVKLPTGGHASPDHMCPGAETFHERGYFVCVDGEQIAQQLPIFINEYNCGEQIDDDMDFDDGFGDAFGGGALPMPLPGGALGDFFNNLVAAVGPPPPFPLPPHGAHAAHGHAVPGGLGASGLAPGFMTAGGGPGYGMLMGSFPVTVNGHVVPPPAAAMNAAGPTNTATATPQSPPTGTHGSVCATTPAAQGSNHTAAVGVVSTTEPSMPAHHTAVSNMADSWTGIEQEWADTDHESDAGGGANDDVD